MTSGDRPADLPGRIVAALDRLARAQRAHRQTVAERHSLTPLQLDLLRVVADGAPPEPVVGQLARELAVSQPTVTDAVHTLARKGLLARRRDPADARRRVVELAPRGAALATELQQVDGPLRDAVAALDPTAQEDTLRSLLGLIAGFVDAGVITVARTCLTCRFHKELVPGRHHCTLLAMDLARGDLRVDCPEHVGVG